MGFFFDSGVCFACDRREGNGVSWSLSPLDKMIGSSLLPLVTTLVVDGCCLLRAGSSDWLVLSCPSDDMAGNVSPHDFEVFDCDDASKFSDEDFFVGAKLPEDNILTFRRSAFSLPFSLICLVLSGD